MKKAFFPSSPFENSSIKRKLGWKTSFGGEQDRRRSSLFEGEMRRERRVLCAVYTDRNLKLS